MSEPLETTLDRVTAAGRALRAASNERVVAWLARALAALGDPASPIGREARTAVADRSGLSREGAAWGLDTTLGALTPAALEQAWVAMQRSHGSYRATPVRAHAIVLASSVLTACLRPMVWTLLARVPAVVKVGRFDEGLAELFTVALSEADAELGAAIAAVRPFGTPSAIYAELAARVDVVSAHGGDHAIAQMRAATSPTTELVAHGHGLGAIVVLRSALSSGVQALVRSIAHDVAAYDQRGCLSPQVIFVERGGELSPRDLASLIEQRGLTALARTMPRGALPVDVGAHQVQWRGLAASLHELFEGDGHAVSFEGEGPVRPTPGYRNVAVHAFDDPARITTRLAVYGPHLKVVAVAGEAERIELAPAQSARLCAPGDMQRPPLLAATDGVAPWHGLVRLG